MQNNTLDSRFQELANLIGNTIMYEIEFEYNPGLVKSQSLLFREAY